jgi:hypothetical protein
MHIKSFASGWAKVAVAAIIGALLLPNPADAQLRRQPAKAAIDLSTPEGNVAAMRRIWCTDKDGETVVWHWKGGAFSRRAGEPDRHLFNVEGLNVRTCAPVSDPQRGQGVRSVSRELLYYLDPKTNAVLSKWTNPWTNETVDVLHVANDPVNGEFWPKRRDGSPAKWEGFTKGDRWFLNSTIPLFYSNPLAGAYQPEIGGTYHATEMFNFMGDLQSLVGANSTGADVYVGWARVSDWLPWMRMGDREGMIYFHTAGRKQMTFDGVSPQVMADIERFYPEYKTPPPVDDKRPNETSWTYFQKIREGKLKAPKRD